MAVELMEPALQQGLILLPAGEQGRVLSIKPSVAHTAEEAAFAMDAIKTLAERHPLQ